MGICGNVPTNEMKGFSGIRQNGFQEMDIVSMTRNITKYSVTANSTEGFPDITSRAYNMAMLGRKGGVIIDFPLDIQQADIIGGEWRQRGRSKHGSRVLQRRRISLS